jgi:hypothetical protein
VAGAADLLGHLAGGDGQVDDIVVADGGQFDARRSL